MRALLAIVLALGLVLGVAAPHVHLASHGDECAVCLVRHGAVAHSETPDGAPRTLHAERVALEPGLAPVYGAPLGAIPGQSPPAGA